MIFLVKKECKKHKMKKIHRAPLEKIEFEILGHFQMKFLHADSSFFVFTDFFRTRLSLDDVTRDFLRHTLKENEYATFGHL